MRLGDEALSALASRIIASLADAAGALLVRLRVTRSRGDMGGVDDILDWDRDVRDDDVLPVLAVSRRDMGIRITLTSDDGWSGAGISSAVSLLLDAIGCGTRIIRSISPADDTRECSASSRRCPLGRLARRACAKAAMVSPSPVGVLPEMPTPHATAEGARDGKTLAAAGSICCEKRDEEDKEA